MSLTLHRPVSWQGQWLPLPSCCCCLLPFWTLLSHPQLPSTLSATCVTSYTSILHAYKLGVYITELTCGWSSHSSQPRLQNSTRFESLGEFLKCQYLYFPQTNYSRSLGIKSQHQYFSKFPLIWNVWFQCLAKVKTRWFNGKQSTGSCDILAMTSDPSVAKLKGTAVGQVREDPRSQGLRAEAVSSSHERWNQRSLGKLIGS